MGIAFVRDRSPIEIFSSLLTKKKSNWGTDPVRVDSLQDNIAQVAELVYALVLGTSAARRGGSSPLLRTKKKNPNTFVLGFSFLCAE